MKKNQKQNLPVFCNCRSKKARDPTHMDYFVHFLLLLAARMELLSQQTGKLDDTLILQLADLYCNSCGKRKDVEEWMRMKGL